MKAVKLDQLAAQYKNGGRDPLMLETIELMRMSNKTNTMINSKCGVSKSCLRSWQKGKTKRPQAATLRFVLRAIGYNIKIERDQ
jgi:hypothetical protein